MRTIDQALDRAKEVQKVKSDYKLSLTIGVSESSLSAYRNGRGLPDELNCKKIAVAMGEDPALLTVEMQAQRAKSDEARAIWLDIAKRLQAGFADVKMLAVLAMFSVAASALPALVALYFAVSSVGASVYYVKRIAVKMLTRLVANVKLCKAGSNVPRHAHAAPFLPA